MENHITAGAYQGLTAQWSYDDFGNRIGANYSGTLADPSQAPPIPGNASATYNANNQVQSADPGPVPTYDSSGDGDMTSDGQNQYLYDAEGRVCAVESLLGRGMYGYLYNAEGVRVAKGTITTFNCNTASNGFQLTASYILDPNNQQLTEMSWSGGTAQWAHSNVFAAGQLIATYSVDPNPSDDQPGILNFLLADWLGTRRAMTDYAGNLEESCHSLPYGEGEDCAPVPTEHLFTQKEYDAESGNDYFPARYYASLTGRFLSPDPSGLYYADPTKPQSLNLYSYVQNNPLINIDPSGMEPCDDDSFNQGDCDILSLGEADSLMYQEPGAASQSDSVQLTHLFDDPEYSVTVNGSGDDGCSMSDPICQLQYEQYLSYSIQFRTVVPLAPNNAQSGSHINWGCIGQGAARAVTAFFGAPAGLPSFPPNANMVIRPARVGLETATPALVTTAGEIGGTATAEAVADAIPVVGEGLLLIQGGVAIYNGVKQYNSCVNGQ